MSGSVRHVGLVAGGGDLPLHVAAAVKEAGDQLTVLEIEPDSPVGRFDDSFRLSLSKFGKVLKHFKRRGVTHVCLAGNVGRPDFSTFRPDLGAMRYLPSTLKAARQGDDSLLRHVMGIFEGQGFSILSPQSICESLLLPAGPLGRTSLPAEHRADAERAMEIASVIGTHDIGQGAVVAGGLVLAVEAQEGTDAMLSRVAQLPAALRGSGGVLAKRLKPGQDGRVDMPTIGLKTVELAIGAGLAGIIVDEGEAFVLDREAVIERADVAGLFIVGLPKRRDNGAA
ncbi:MAG: UDP-2,3-diacylglucosamine diphosphatase LpxI [Litorimonas sp.]